MPDTGETPDNQQSTAATPAKKAARPRKPAPAPKAKATKATSPPASPLKEPGEADPPPNGGPRQQKRVLETPLWLAIAGAILVPIAVAAAGVGGAVWGSNSQSEDNRETIKAERDRVIEQFRLDQQQEQYAAIRQQATRLENASDFSTSAVAGFLLSDLGKAAGPAATPLPNQYTGEAPKALSDSLSQVKGLLGGDEMLGARRSYNDYYYDTYAGGNSWQEAYAGLDQAISNAEIAGSEDVINIARALRDKYRDEYYKSILDNIDDVIAKYPDPKPQKTELADLLVGVPAEDGPRTYDPALLAKSTNELTTLYVEAAKDDLELDEPQQ